MRLFALERQEIEHDRLSREDQPYRNVTARGIVQGVDRSVGHRLDRAGKDSAVTIGSKRSRPDLGVGAVKLEQIALLLSYCRHCSTTEPRRVTSLAPLRRDRHRPSAIRATRVVVDRVLECGKDSRQMPDERVRRRVMEAVARGLLPPSIPKRSWGGFGSDNPCSVCGRTITTEEIETEFEDGARRLYHLHMQCFATWEALTVSTRNAESLLPLPPSAGYGAPREQPTREPG
jgi:hypothetical protein